MDARILFVLLLFVSFGTKAQVTANKTEDYVDNWFNNNNFSERR